VYDINLRDHYLTIVAIDPGTNTLGLTVLTANPSTKEVVVLESETLVGVKLSKCDYTVKDLIYDNSPTKDIRLRALRNELLNIFHRVQPDIIVCESYYLRIRKVNAFEALIEAVTYIRHAVHDYDERLPIYFVMPNAAKEFVGTKIKRGMEKDDVKVALIKYIKNTELLTINVDIETLSEHAIDSLVIGLKQAGDILK
jgi:Holliday junction resolvasome RuvABC endonuclease subunit